MSHGHPDKPHALAAMAGSGNICPVCGKRMSCGKWYPQPGKRFMTMAACEADGAFLVRVRLAEDPDGTLRANRLVYSADSEAAENYRRLTEKPVHHRRRRSGRARAKKAGAEPKA